jgi:nitric oxide reductase NorE protein
VNVDDRLQPAMPPARPQPAQARHIPGEEGVWLFVLGDALVFSLFFATFLYYRADGVEAYAASQAKLNQTLGVFNTFLMLTSSWFAAMAVQAAKHGRAHLVPRLLTGALTCGAGFVAVKFFEYREKIEAGITLTSNDFFMYYYMFTGIHLVHVLIGMAVLVFLLRQAFGSGTPDTTRLRHLESGVTFWHLVDLLWIVLFGLLYLVK